MKKPQLIFGVFALLMSIIVFTSCESSDAEPVFMGQEYFGQTPGAWIIYDVDSTVYDDFLGEIFHYNYQVKEVKSHYVDNTEGGQSMRLERYYRPDSVSQWQIKNVWKSRISSAKAIRTEENVSFVKLTFPVKLNQSWDGNAFNTLENQQYTVTDIHQPMEIESNLFDSTLTVLQKDFSSLIGEELQYEVYAINIGMLIKRYVDIGKEIDGTITRGVDYSYRINAFGFNDE